MVKLLITKPFDQQNNLDITDSGNRFCLLTLHWLLKYAHSCVRPVVSASQILSVARGCGQDWTCIYEKKAQEVYTMLSCGAGGHVMSKLEALFGKVVGPLGSGISLGSVGHYWVGWLLRLYSQLLLPAHSLLPTCRCSVTSQSPGPPAMSSPPWRTDPLFNCKPK